MSNKTACFTIKLDIAKIKCALCKEYLRSAPVFVQYSGDTICERCNKISEKISFRNKLYEDMMKAALLPCRFATKGCTKQLQFNHCANHENVCDYKDKFKCPISTCNWVGKIEMLLNHFFQDAHNATVVLSQSFCFPKNGQVFKLLQAKQRNFVIWVNAIHQKITIEVISLDLQNSVDYKLSLYKPNASEDGEIRKKGRTRILDGGKVITMEFDKKLITDMLGRTESLECHVSFECGC